jgi:hypothetical protein
MPFSFNGIGTKYYGSRDFSEDGSYITTEWFIILFVPVVPLRSFRVSPIKKRWFGSQEYWAWKVPLCKPQVRNTYLAVFLVGLAIAPLFALNKHQPFFAAYITLLLVLAIAWAAISSRQRFTTRRSSRVPSAEPGSFTPPPTTVDPQREPSNPLDHHWQINVTEEQLQRRETLHFKVPFKDSMISLQLKPEMRNKTVRLQGLFAKGAGDLLVRVSVGTERGGSSTAFPHERL